MALETYVPQRGALTIETLHDGDLVGWSWLVPPYRTMFDARALARHAHGLLRRRVPARRSARPTTSSATSCSSRFTAVIVERLQATRLRLLDLYGDLPG